MNELKLRLDGNEKTRSPGDLDHACLLFFGLVPHQVNLLPEDWRAWPGGEILLKKIAATLRLSLSDSSTLSIPHDTWPFLPLYLAVLRDEGYDKPAFEIHIGAPAGAGGQWLANTLSALRSTRGFPRTLTVERGATNVESASEGLPSSMKKLWDLCLRATADTGLFEKGGFDQEIEDLFQATRVLLEMSTAVILPEGSFILGWRDSGAWKQSQVPFSPSGAWETIRLEVQAPPSEWILIDPYQSPAYMWIRRAVWKTNGREWPAKVQPRYAEDLLSLNDLVRLSVYGPSPAAVQMPPLSPASLELEVMFEAGDAILEEMIASLAERVTGARASMGGRGR